MRDSTLSPIVRFDYFEWIFHVREKNRPRWDLNLDSPDLQSDAVSIGPRRRLHNNNINTGRNTISFNPYSVSFERRLCLLPIKASFFLVGKTRDLLKIEEYFPDTQSHNSPTENI